MADRGLILRRKNFVVDYTQLRSMQLFRIRDTPLRSLYRLYECTCTLAHNEMMEESQYFFHGRPNWRVKDIPDPQDPDPVRYAILASLAETLVTSFNLKISMGLRRGITHEKPLLIFKFRDDPDPPLEDPPTWCAEVKPLTDPLPLRPGSFNTGSKMTSTQGSRGEHFAKRNIMADVHQLWNF